MIFYTILCLLNTLETPIIANNNPIILIYPDVTTRNVSFNFTVDENICQLSDVKTMSILQNNKVIQEKDIIIENGKINISYFEGFLIQNINDLGESSFFPIVCTTPFSEYRIRYFALYRPNLTINADNKTHTKNDNMTITGNITDWDSTQLNLTINLNNQQIKQMTIEKRKSTDDYPYTITFPLKTAMIGENNITVIVTDNQNLSSNQTMKFQIKGIEPNFTLKQDESYIIGDTISFKISIDRLDIIDYFKVYYAFDNQDWVFFKEIQINNETKLPYDIVLNMDNQLHAGYHSLKVKLIDSNGLESNTFHSKKFLIQHPPSPTIAYPTPSPIQLIKTLTYTIINGVRTQYYTYVERLEIDKIEQERERGSWMTPAILITLVTIGCIVIFLIAFLGLALYRRLHAPDDPSSSESSINIEIGEQRSVTTVVENQENFVLDEETKKNFNPDDLEYMFRANF